MTHVKSEDPVGTGISAHNTRAFGLQRAIAPRACTARGCGCVLQSHAAKCDCKSPPTFLMPTKDPTLLSTKKKKNRKIAQQKKK
jgi:hypothetical protein